LCLVLQTPESAAVDDAFAISLEFRPEVMGLFGMFATQTFFAFGGIAGKESGFFLLPVLSGSDRHSSGMKMRDGKSRDRKIPSTKDVNSGWIRSDKYENIVKISRRVVLSVWSWNSSGSS